MKRQKVQVHILPTKETCLGGILLRIPYYEGEDFEPIMSLNLSPTLQVKQLLYLKPQHLYFTSDEKIEEGDWCILLENHYINGGVGKYNEEKAKGYGLHNTKFFRKIVATTDKSLHLKPKLRVGSILTSEKLPQIPQSFIKQYVEADGKIEEVELERERVDTLPRAMDGSSWGKLVIKTDSNNCVIVQSIEDSWNREEVIKILKKFEKYLDKYPSAKTSFVRMDNWIEKNL